MIRLCCILLGALLFVVAKTIVQEEMMRVAKLNVPLIADAHIGKNWLDAK